MKSKLTREEQAKIEIGHTDIAKITSRVLVIAFLCMIGSIPIVQGIYELNSYITGKDKSFLPSFLKMYSVAGNTINCLWAGRCHCPWHGRLGRGGRGEGEAFGSSPAAGKT